MPLSAMTVRVRVATPADAGALESLIDLSTRMLLTPFLTFDAISASLELMTLDRRLIEDGTYFVAEREGMLVASGGWGRRCEYVNRPAAIECGPCEPINGEGHGTPS